MNQVLIIYEMVPEETLLYVLNDVSDVDLAWMVKCNNKFINTQMTDEEEELCNKLSVYLADRPQTQYTYESHMTIQGYTTVILTGFIL